MVEFCSFWEVFPMIDTHNVYKMSLAVLVLLKYEKYVKWSPSTSNSLIKQTCKMILTGIIKTKFGHGKMPGYLFNRPKNITDYHSIQSQGKLFCLRKWKSKCHGLCFLWVQSRKQKSLTNNKKMLEMEKIKCT